MILIPMSYQKECADEDKSIFSLGLHSFISTMPVIDSFKQIGLGEFHKMGFWQQQKMGI